MNKLSFFFLLIGGSALLSCSKYKDVQDADYPEQRLYMPTAVQGNANNGLYEIKSVAAPGVVFRYTIDMAARRINIPLGVYRSGVDTKGAINVSLAANADTVNRLVTAGVIAGGQVLPPNRFSLSPTVTIADGSSAETATLSVDLDYLLANPTVRHAIGVSISSTDRPVNPSLGLTVVVIDPAFLTPVANFSAAVTAATRSVSFSNTSANAVSFAWSFGDGTTSVERAPVKTYAASGTYTVTLTATGALGAASTATKTADVIIP